MEDRNKGSSSAESEFQGKKEHDHYRWKAHHKEGLIFFVDPSVIAQMAQGEADLWVTHQHVVLGMLAEQILQKSKCFH